MSTITQQPPFITVIIPTRNGAATLRELLAMLSQQTILLQDIHVVDSESTDDTVAVAEAFDVKA